MASTGIMSVDLKDNTTSMYCIPGDSSHINHLDLTMMHLYVQSKIRHLSDAVAFADIGVLSSPSRNLLYNLKVVSSKQVYRMLNTDWLDIMASLSAQNQQKHRGMPW